MISEESAGISPEIQNKIMIKLSTKERKKETKYVTMRVSIIENRLFIQSKNLNLNL